MKTKSHRRTFLKRGALLGSGLWLASLASSRATTENPPAAEANIWEVFRQRRSVRKFRPDAIPEKDIVKMIEAARLAPTSGNQQPWKFLVIRDPNKIRQLKEACIKAAMERFAQSSPAARPKEKEEQEKSSRAAFDNYLSASVYIVVLTDNKSQYPDYNHWDGPLAAGYLMLAARALGYGTVHITDSIPDSVTKTVLRIPDRYTRICITPVGIPVEWPGPNQKGRLEEFLAYESV